MAVGSTRTMVQAAPVPRSLAAGGDREVFILGTRGVPAAHGGFETFAEHFALHLARSGRRVSVYCQEDDPAPDATIREEEWRGVRRIVVPAHRPGSRGSIEFDWACVRDVIRRDGVILVLGYNTGIFAPVLRARNRDVFINMDGIEWKRPKWSRAVRAWFWANEHIAARSGKVLIADHPVLAEHLRTRASGAKIVTIPYGADEVTEADPDLVTPMGIVPERYFVTICRIEPENSILPMVRAFAAVPRDRHLVMLGKLDPANAYHRAVREAANDKVLFPGAIYDKAVVDSLRFHARAYCHGHTVGGTNPSLVEAMSCGAPVFAHDNPFNRWTAGEGQFFYADEAACRRLLDTVADDDARIRAAKVASRARFRERFRLDQIHAAYERLLAGASVDTALWAPAPAR